MAARTGAKLKIEIKKDLLNQLECNGTVGKYYIDLVDDYMRCWELKNGLQADIKGRGAKVEKLDSRGQKHIVNNDSIDQLIKVQASMARILESLGIRPVEGESSSIGAGVCDL